MNYRKLQFEELEVTAEVAAYEPKEGVTEWHVILHVNNNQLPFGEQLGRLYEAEDRLPGMPEFWGAQYIMKRYFLSDSTNQQPLMRQQKNISVSLIQQQPLDGTKIAAWLYLQSGVEVKEQNGAVVVSHNGYRHLWKMGMVKNQGDSARQTEELLTEYEAMLSKFNATLAENCIRTWFFVRDVDTNYHGLVVARRENFIQQGLTEKTHYISSTGIGGSPADTKALVQLGTYAITGLEPEQQHYLYAPTHLNPTYEYGVTFERGTVVEYGDREHVFISGTASINNKGEVVHVGDIVLQTQRMWENVEALLKEGETGWEDVMQIVVYLRDTADYEVVRQLFAERFPHIPTVITLAPVCRPTWLVEMECIAVKEKVNERFRNF
ncbi:MAG: hypothetical protein IJ826_10645 [Bacteroidaceae bacterium]|jgi:enamine deaminase RidA (YjgF/YER057c/UK114 family)|nr:hypothetical protein [Bacteroidaceae bacterium]